MFEESPILRRIQLILDEEPAFGNSRFLEEISEQENPEVPETTEEEKTNDGQNGEEKDDGENNNTNEEEKEGEEGGEGEEPEEEEEEYQEPIYHNGTHILVNETYAYPIPEGTNFTEGNYTYVWTPSYAAIQWERCE